MPNKRPMSDYERQKILDQSNVKVINVDRNDVFETAKQMLTAVCELTGQPVPSDEEIWAVVQATLDTNQDELDSKHNSH